MEQGVTDDAVDSGADASVPAFEPDYSLWVGPTQISQNVVNYSKLSYNLLLSKTTVSDCRQFSYTFRKTM